MTIRCTRIACWITKATIISRSPLNIRFIRTLFFCKLRGNINFLGFSFIPSLKVFSHPWLHSCADKGSNYLPCEKHVPFLVIRIFNIFVIRSFQNIPRLPQTIPFLCMVHHGKFIFIPKLTLNVLKI
jgi:hypothetical protein